MLESEVSELFNELKDFIPNTVNLQTHKLLKIKPINRHSTLGEQIKFYRQMARISQEELAQKISTSKYSIRHIENLELKLVDIPLLKTIINQLDIADKLNYNDDYISFLLGNPDKEIQDFRKATKMTRPQFAKMLDTSVDSVKRWENGKGNISRISYNKIKKYMSL